MDLALYSQLVHSRGWNVARANILPSDQLLVSPNLIELRDHLYSSLKYHDAGKAAEFLATFQQLVQTHADFSRVPHELAIWILTSFPRDFSETFFIRSCERECVDGELIMQHVISLHRRIVDGLTVSDDEWEVARYALNYVQDLTFGDSFGEQPPMALYMLEFSLNIESSRFPASMIDHSLYGMTNHAIPPIYDTVNKLIELMTKASQ